MVISTHHFSPLPARHAWRAFCYKGRDIMANPKYKKWLEPDGLTMIEGWARRGLTEEQIAKNMGVSRRTLTVWKQSHDPILHALKRGKEVVDFEVENALLKRACGYEIKETTRERRLNEKTGEMEMIVTKTITKAVLPDVTAQIFWLKNRRPDLWRDRPDPDQTETLSAVAKILDGIDSVIE